MHRKSAERLLFLFVALIFFQDGEIFAQGIRKIPPALSIETQSISFKSQRRLTERSMLAVKLVPYGGKIDLSQSKKIAQPLDGGYFHDNLAFFCRTELRVEKAISVPLRFRLGSLAYADYLEGKPNSRKP